MIENRDKIRHKPRESRKASAGYAGGFGSEPISRRHLERRPILAIRSRERLREGDLLPFRRSQYVPTALPGFRYYTQLDGQLKCDLTRGAFCQKGDKNEQLRGPSSPCLDAGNLTSNFGTGSCIGRLRSSKWRLRQEDNR